MAQAESRYTLRHFEAGLDFDRLELLESAERDSRWRPLKWLKQHE